MTHVRQEKFRTNPPNPAKRRKASEFGTHDIRGKDTKVSHLARDQRLK
jgi:hypothetical protein